MVQQVSPQKKKCTSDGCAAKVSVTDKYCSACGSLNSHYSEEQASLLDGKRSGWKKAPEWLTVVPETETERDLAKGGGSLQAAAPGEAGPTGRRDGASAAKPACC